MTALLEHTNYTVSDPQATAAWMIKLFGWHIRWQGDTSMGHTVHVGTQDRYLALYSPGQAKPKTQDNYTHVAGLNHLAVTVEDLPAMEDAVRAHGFPPHSHADYEPGKRFYFHDQDGIEYEVVSYS